MKECGSRLGRFVFVFLLAVLCALVGIIVTYARYEAERVSDSGIYGSDLEYLLADQVEVDTVEEFIAAVKNGYSNIIISDSVEDPLVITSGVTDVGSDLILDLNGHELQRNNREPMLNIIDGVRMTIIDSEGGGSFYNPVGSVLAIGGGTLTVAAGEYISGPKKTEYSDAENGAGGSLGGSVVTTLYARVEGDEYAGTSGVTLPVVVPHVTRDESSGIIHVNGNMYLSESPDETYGGVIAKDSYLYYVIGDEGVADSRIASNGSADYAYTYNVRRTDGADGLPSYAVTDEEEDGESVFAVTIYVYGNVKGSATGETNYATVQMSAGNMYVRGGDYRSYFGISETYGIYASGGYMSVETGSTFDSIENGVCIFCEYPSDGTARADEYLRISGGSFSSDTGDTLRVSDGTMVVTGGEFSKDTSSSADPAFSSVIMVDGGNLEIASPAKGNVRIEAVGSNVRGIYVSGGTASVTNAEVTLNGGKEDGVSYSAHTFGILSEGGSLDLGGTVNVSVEGEYSSGIYAAGGDITYNGGGRLDVGAYIPDDITLLSTTGISVESGEISLCGKVSVVSDGLGVTVRGSASAEGGLTYSGTGEFSVTANRTTAIYVNGGSAEFTGGSVTVKSVIDGGASWADADGNKTSARYDGICVEGGSLNAKGTYLEVRHTGIENDGYGNYDDLEVKSYAVRVTSSAQSGAYVSIVHADIENTVGGGLYVSGGETSIGSENGDFTTTVSATGKEVFKDENGNIVYYDPLTGGVGGGNAWHFAKNVKGGHAVEVVGGSLTVYSGSYSAAMGNGILVNGGTATVNGGTFIGADSYAPNTEGSAAVAGPAASYALKMYGGSLTVKGGTFGSTDSTKSKGSGAFIMGSESGGDTATITGGSFNVCGTAGISVYKNADIVLGTAGDTKNENELEVSGQSAAITIESGATNAEVTVYSGDYYCNSPADDHNSDGIWYNESSASLFIYGGRFSGSSATWTGGGEGRSGLYFETAPDAGKVKINGGSFYGDDAVTETSWWGSSVYVRGGAIGVNGSARIYSGYDGVEINVTDIIDDNTDIIDGNMDVVERRDTLHEYLSKYTAIIVTQGA